MKAYSVQGDEHGCVVFADKAVVARRKGANELDIGFEDVESCRRVPQFDQYAEAGKVPMQAYLDAGWWWACGNCERQVWGDDEDYVVHNDTAYCCEACRDADLAYLVMRGRRIQAAIDWAHANWPGTVVRYASVFNDKFDVSFTFPGGQHQADFRNGKLWICRDDVKAWEAFTGKAAESSAQGKEQSK